MTGCHAPAYAARGGKAGSRSSIDHRRAARISVRSVSGIATVRGGTLTSVATTEPSVAVLVETETGPAFVACPQNGPSASGLKYRMPRLPSSSGTTNAVSEKPTSAAVASIVESSTPVASSTTPAGLPPAGSVLNAAYRNISIDT